MTRMLRSVAVTISVLAIFLPHPLPAQSVMSRAPTPDITAYLPPVTAVPWLDQKAPVRKRAPKIDVGSITAWLWMPTPTPTWPERQAQIPINSEPLWM